MVETILDVKGLGSFISLVSGQVEESKFLFGSSLGAVFSE